MRLKKIKLMIGALALLLIPGVSAYASENTSDFSKYRKIFEDANISEVAITNLETQYNDSIGTEQEGYLNQLVLELVDDIKKTKSRNLDEGKETVLKPNQEKDSNGRATASSITPGDIVYEPNRAGSSGAYLGHTSVVAPDTKYIVEILGYGYKSAFYCSKLSWRQYYDRGRDIDSNGGAMVTPKDIYNNSIVKLYHSKN